METERKIVARLEAAYRKYHQAPALPTQPDKPAPYITTEI